MAVGDAYVFPGFLTPVLTLLFFQSHRLLFSHASAEVRGENTPERKVASTWDRTHNHQVMSPTRSPLSHPGGFLENYGTKEGVLPQGLLYVKYESSITYHSKAMAYVKVFVDEQRDRQTEGRKTI